MQVFGFSVETESWGSDHGDGEDSGEEFSYRGTTTTYWSIVDVVRTSSHPDVLLALPDGQDFIPGQTYYLVAATYSTGDSFGYDHGARFESFRVYADRAVAEEAIRRLEAADSYQTMLPDGVGGEYEAHVPWAGYFESLDEVYIREFSC